SRSSEVTALSTISPSYSLLQRRHPSRVSWPSSCAAGALRGRPESTTSTERRARSPWRRAVAHYVFWYPGTPVGAPYHEPSRCSLALHAFTDDETGQRTKRNG